MANSVLMVVKIPTLEKQLSEFHWKDEKSSVVDKCEVKSYKQDASSFSFEPLKGKLEETLKEINAKDATWQLTQDENFWRVCFTCEMEETDSILEMLASKCIGSYKDTYVGILPFSFILKDDELMDQVFDTMEEHLNDESQMVAMYKGHFTNAGFTNDESNSISKGNFNRSSKKLDFKSFQERFLRSITARMTVAQVAASVKAGSDLTFDFFVYIIMASWISVMGLMENSLVTLVAAMLVSPLMGSGKVTECAFFPFIRLVALSLILLSRCLMVLFYIYHTHGN